MKIIDMAGQRFEKALVVERAPNKSASDTNARWHCKCDCGKEFISYGQDLRKGKVKSCGCLTRGTMGARSKHFNSRHGLSNTKVHNVWSGMLNRCNNPRNGKWRHYGGRGIKVSDAWLTFENFLNDMGVPEAGMTLDRIDPNGNYCKENCRWATRQEQSANRRNCRRLTHNGVTLTAAEWARALGISPTTMAGRIDAGFPPEKLFARNMKPRDRRKL